MRDVGDGCGAHSDGSSCAFPPHLCDLSRFSCRLSYVASLRRVSLSPLSVDVQSLGSSKLHTACNNPSATPEMLTNLYRDGTTTQDVNLCRAPKTFVWGLILRLFETMVRLRFATSDFAADMAHTRGATALHTAAGNGYTPLVKWLLDHDARPSLHVKDAMGCTPLDVSHVFGPFPETEAVLTRAILEKRTSSNAPVPPRQSAIAIAEMFYPMYLLPVRTLLDLSVLPRHEDLIAQEKLVKWQPEMCSVFYVSLEGTSRDHPDPGGKRLDVLKRLLTRMVQGRAANVEADYASRAAFGKGRKITPGDWRELANDAHVWISFCCAPTAPSPSMEAAMRSFVGYIERSTHIFALCPPTKYENDSNRTCDFRSWYDRGLARVELSALLLAVVPKPAILITGDDSPTPVIDVTRLAMSLLSGRGRFDCCGCDHVRVTDGLSMSIPCEKLMARQTMIDLLERRIDHHRHRGELDEMRLWKSLSPRFLWGLSVETTVVSHTPEAFLREFEFTPDDEPGSSPVAEGRQSKQGVSPLFLAVVSGNDEVTRGSSEPERCDGAAQIGFLGSGLVGGW